MTSNEDLLVFGYASRIYPPDERSDFIAEEQHLIVSPNDPSLRCDRRLGCSIDDADDIEFDRSGVLYRLSTRR
ncbi:hypothetical protein Q1695_016094 [Nippostrongylus brasiliensis]|nr:hypothetical protein Q1695_016094 [Nippostrongylus brasiliensis]